MECYHSWYWLILLFTLFVLYKKNMLIVLTDFFYFISMSIKNLYKYKKFSSLSFTFLFLLFYFTIFDIIHPHLEQESSTKMDLFKCLVCLKILDIKIAITMYIYMYKKCINWQWSGMSWGSDFVSIFYGNISIVFWLYFVCSFLLKLKFITTAKI